MTTNAFNQALSSYRRDFVKAIPRFKNFIAIITVEVTATTTTTVVA